MAVNSKPGRTPEEEDDGEGSGEHRAKFAVPCASSEGEVAQVEQKGADLVKIQAKLDELVLSRDQHVRALEQRIEQYGTEVAGLRAGLEASRSDLKAVRLPPTEVDSGLATRKTESDTLGLVNTDEGQITRGLVERMRAMEAEMESLRLGEKSSEDRNEG
jgi:hypothetical protein